jgi:hypothetical protein
MALHELPPPRQGQICQEQLGPRDGDSGDAHGVLPGHP